LTDPAGPGRDIERVAPARRPEQAAVLAAAGKATGAAGR
jgi:hypothetical protein